MPRFLSAVLLLLFSAISSTCPPTIPIFVRVSNNGQSCEELAGEVLLTVDL